MKKIKELFVNDSFILVVIILNSITIFVQGFDISHLAHRIIVSIDVLFTLIFAIEMLVKINILGFKKYAESGWNKLDALLVILALPSVIDLFIPSAVTDLHFLLVFRISRVFKFFRFLKFIPGINQIIKGVKIALKDSVLILLGFAIYNFVTAVFSCYLFKDISPEYFGDPIKSFYSTFKVFTVEGWYEIPEEILKDSSDIVSFFGKAYFIIILMTGGILGLSLVNSIFVDAMVSDNNDDLIEKVEALEKKVDILIQELINNKKTE